MDSNIVELVYGDNNKVKIHLFGATVISWTCNGVEQLFLSSISKMDGSKAIRGGIPIVFPNFGPWSCGPQHGFARINWWKKGESKQLKDGAKMTFTLRENEKTLAMWNFKFQLTYTVTLTADKLITSLTVENTGKELFDFTCLLHTYFRLSDIAQCSITGFQGCKYDDKVTKETDVTETHEKVKITENVDRVYRAAGFEGHVIESQGRRILLEKENLPDTVLWNPWSIKAAEMSDFDDDGYHYMVCVEAGYVSERKILAPGGCFSCSQKMIASFS